MTSAAARQLTTRHRTQQLALRAGTIRELLRLWSALDWRRLDKTYPAWASVVGRLIDDHRDRSSTLAANYLRAFRLAEGISSAAPVILDDGVPAAQLTIALRVTSIVAVKAATARGVGAQPAMARAFVRSSGTVSRLVLDGGRRTVLGSLDADDRARGWVRVSDGSPCSFCAMLVSRGAVYKASTVDFRSHDACACTAEPLYHGDGHTSQSRRLSDLWAQSTAGHSGGAAIAAFRRAYEGTAA